MAKRKTKAKAKMAVKRKISTPATVGRKKKVTAAADIYYDLAHPLAYTGNLKKLVKEGVDPQWLETQPTFTLHRAVRKRFPTRKYRASAPNYQWQSDLVDMQHLKTQNKGFAWILTAIDVFTRYAYAVPIKTKAFKDVSEGFISIFKHVSSRGSDSGDALSPIPLPSLIQTDQGKEFENKNIQEFFKERGIKQFSVMSPYKAALVERFHRTLRGRMYRYFTKNGTRRWHDILQSLVNGYNNTKHSSLNKRTPASITQENAMGVWEDGEDKIKQPNPNTAKFKVGDLVRLAIAKRVFSHGYTPNWTEEIFQIVGVDTRVSPIMYTVKDLEDGEVIRGRFYRQELQRVANVFRIEKILRTKKQGDKMLYYVKW